MDIKFTRGFEFRLPLDVPSATLVLMSDDAKHIFNTVDDNTLIIVASDTEKVSAGKYSLQLLSDTRCHW